MDCDMDEVKIYVDDVHVRTVDSSGEDLWIDIYFCMPVGTSNWDYNGFWWGDSSCSGCND